MKNKVFALTNYFLGAIKTLVVVLEQLNTFDCANIFSVIKKAE